jgi:peptidoglycan/LPS O-acetylase OafA/YrhL
LSNTRIHFIDGIRGIAILLVFLAHISAGVFPNDIGFFKDLSFFLGGGLIGVQLFFALSGYLITRNLLSEFQAHGNIDFKLFYLRRFWRLYPVLLLACSAYLLYVLVFMEPILIIAALGDIFMSITYTTNLPIYPAWFPDLDWMTHTWSLSVEEQFYILWPVIFLILISYKSKIQVITVTILLILISILLRYYLPEFSYSIFRWDAIMIGCLLNFIKIPKNWMIIIFSVSTITYYSWVIPNPIKNLDYLITSISCGAFISQGGFMNILNNKFLIYFGKISYSLYLWHFFFMRLGYPGYLNLSVSILLADFSYRFFEVPVLNWAKSKFNLTR